LRQRGRRLPPAHAALGAITAFGFTLEQAFAWVLMKKCVYFTIPAKHSQRMRVNPCRSHLDFAPGMGIVTGFSLSFIDKDKNAYRGVELLLAGFSKRVLFLKVGGRGQVLFY
jgi:hypothetical protein